MALIDQVSSQGIRPNALPPPSSIQCTLIHNWTPPSSGLLLSIGAGPPEVPMYQIVCFSPSVREDSITVPSLSNELDVTLLTFRRLPLRKGGKRDHTAGYLLVLDLGSVSLVRWISTSKVWLSFALSIMPTNLPSKG